MRQGKKGCTVPQGDKSLGDNEHLGRHGPLMVTNTYSDKGCNHAPEGLKTNFGSTVGSVRGKRSIEGPTQSTLSSGSPPAAANGRMEFRKVGGGWNHLIYCLFPPKMLAP